MNLKDALKNGKDILEKNGVDPREARLLMAHALKISSDELIKHDTCTDEEVKIFTNMVQMRAEKIPFAYIVGEKEFMKLKFNVNENVLIPRDDTELLVCEALKTNKTKILDMCTGSGCIAISLAHYIGEKADITAVDISEKALEVAKSNALLNDVNVKFIKSNLFENVKEKYELIVSNPPYIRSDVILTLQEEVKNEPILALDGGKSGLEFYEIIINKAKDFLLEDGTLMLEIGYDQAEDVTKIAKLNGYKDIEVLKDFGGNDRVVKCQI